MAIESYLHLQRFTYEEARLHKPRIQFPEPEVLLFEPNKMADLEHCVYSPYDRFFFLRIQPHTRMEIGRENWQLADAPTAFCT